MLQKLSMLAFLLFFATASYSQNISGIVNEYSKVLHVDVNKGRLKLANVSGYNEYIGRKVMIIQMKGATINADNNNSFGNITAINNAGLYEVNQICGFINDTMLLRKKLTHQYDVSGAVQVVIMPDVTNAVVVDVVRAKTWSDADGTGGVVALDMTGTLTLNKPIDVSGQGFVGGECLRFTATCFSTSGDIGYHYTKNTSAFSNGAVKGEGIAATIINKEAGRGKQANGGGGGNNHNAGGGGGSNVGAGGLGGEKTDRSCRSNTPGIGGASLSSLGYSATNNRIFMGGGGGSGHDNNGYGMSGGNGGGIIFIRAATIIGSAMVASDNVIKANGLVGSRFIPLANGTFDYSWSDGAGGGGAGGSVVLHVNDFSGTNVSIAANGGKGSNSEGVGNDGCAGPGGGGGGGAIWFKKAAQPANVITNVSGGANGIVQFSANVSCNGSANNATAGSSGTVYFNHTMPVLIDTATVCSGVLVSTASLVLRGVRQSVNYNLTAQLLSPIPVQTVVLQRTNATNGPFIDLQSLPNNNMFNYGYTDPVAKRTTIYYRAKLTQPNNNVIFSNVVALKDSTTDKLLLQVLPNPVAFNGVLRITAPETEKADIIIYDAKGTLVLRQEANLQFGSNDVNLFLPNLQLGHYFIKVFTPSASGTTRFVKATVY